MSETYHLAGTIDEFRPERGRAVKVAGHVVAIFRLDEGWFALKDSCPHMGASLADGKIQDCKVTCFWHGWRFDLRSGQGDMRRWTAQVYPLEIRGKEVYVAIPDPEPAGGSDEDAEWIRWDDEKFFKKKGTRDTDE